MLPLLTMSNKSNTRNILSDGEFLPLVEDFYTIQGEGFHTGKPAYFIRLGGCDVGCKWCDAKSTWNASIHPPVSIEEITNRVVSCSAKYIVITGGEPTLYPLEKFTSLLKRNGLEVFLETSGTQQICGIFDWICLSPKENKPPLKENFQHANELKVIIQTETDIQWAESCSTQVSDGCLLYLQPEWSERNKMTPFLVEYVKSNPRWNISIQTHKYINIP